jgi:hypothetical protein
VRVRVLHGEPAGWYLLDDGGALYLDVNCNQSAVSFGILIRLDPAEQAQFAGRGRAYAGELAEQIAWSPRTHWPRNVTGPVASQVHDAIMAHLRDNSPAG